MCQPMSVPRFGVYLEWLKTEPHPEPLRSRRVKIVVPGDVGNAHLTLREHSA